MRAVLFRTALACSLFVCWYASACEAQPADDAPSMAEVSLGRPPRASGAELGLAGSTESTQPAARLLSPLVQVNGFTVLPAVRSSVVSFYENVYLPALSVPMGWSGTAASCDAGSTSQAYVDASFDLINFYRAMVELPPVANDVAKNAASQEAALMMSVNNSLSHAPPTDWQCYTAAGATAAGSSNIALGAAGPRAIALYIKDPGTTNNFAGHRRWILHPPRASFGIGSVGGSTRDANALWVFAGTTTRPPTDVIAWPPRGFVPYPLVYSRWSFSLNDAPSANYSSANVSMHENGAPVALNIVSRTANGYGDNTLVWEPSGLTFPAGKADRAFEIVVSGIGNASQSSYSYRVTVIDPAVKPQVIFSDDFE